MSSRKKHGEIDLFRQAMSDVTPLPAHGRIEPELPKPPARAFQQALDDQAALRELLRMEIDADCGQAAGRES